MANAVSAASASGTAYDRWCLEAAIALLKGSRWVAGLSFLLASIAGVALAATDLQGVYARIAASGALALGAAAAYLALRVEMDEHFFRAFRDATSAVPESLAAFDAALQSLGWVTAAKAGRELCARVRGTRRLVSGQAIVLLAQLLLVAAIPWLR